VLGPSSRLRCERGGRPVTPPEVCRLVARSPGRVTAEVDLRAPATLVHGATLVPGWSARLDGVELPLATAHGVLQGLDVPAGRHAVELAYRTPGLVLGAMFSAATALALAVALVVVLRRRRRARGDRAA
jgi:uncharacterized membrane protein YfhO